MTVEEFINQWRDGSDTVEVHTSGSTGDPKVMHVEKRRMLASARATCDFLGLKKGDTALLAAVNEALAKAYEAGWYGEWYEQALALAASESAIEVSVEE